MTHPPPDAVERVVSADDTAATVPHSGPVAPPQSPARLSHSDKDVSKKDASANLFEVKLPAALRSPSDTPSKERVWSQHPTPPVVRNSVLAQHSSCSNSSSKNDIHIDPPLKVVTEYPTPREELRVVWQKALEEATWDLETRSEERPKNVDACRGYIGDQISVINGSAWPFDVSARTRSNLPRFPGILYLLSTNWAPCGRGVYA